eukprot:CAMPEP_0184661950 /NCGR_PEP_ID=MMETSP0308-20130426/40934_1 /TAXON_ID=38269 /ORGANISM="Gloeochaete witrockiana, Strain SAG 46.84" /LENGTH=448 /DNA_ID=CAMNT_0027103637 /DNA_START=164 /DNA_END=1510 /DNA_ORIENTATION=-
MTHNLLRQYGVTDHMEVQRPKAATDMDMMKFHADDYVNFLKMISPENSQDYEVQLVRFNINEDNPIFDGLYEFCQISAGASICGAAKINSKAADIAVNWSGGRHHAKKSEASGFCYINDIVLAILELLKHHARVLYVDIDIHHGDGVEEAFYTTNRVMTVSFHKFGEYFPGTGDVRDVGAEKGKHYALNFPLRDGIDDESYQSVFKPVISKVMDMYQPGAVVLQCGADSLSADRLGCFNLSMKGHGECVEYLKSFNVPLLLLGGGGYTIRNVSRCWTYETATAVGLDLPDDLPYNDYYSYYGPDYKLQIMPSNMENQNSREYLDSLKSKLLEQLRHVEAVPSVPFQEVPADVYKSDSDEEDRDPDVRISTRDRDKHVAKPGEFSDSEDEGDAPTQNGIAGRYRRKAQVFEDEDEETRNASSSAKMSIVTNKPVTSTQPPHADSDPMQL